MSHFIDKLTFFTQEKPEPFSDGHGITTSENRSWEKAYRGRWSHDKIVRSTHGVNCTGSCSWKIYVKGGLVTWETQQTDYPRTRPDLPNHEPRGCSRGASYSWYLYSSARVKYPMIRGKLLKLWRETKNVYRDPVIAWEHIVGNEEKAKSYKQARGLGGFVRAEWDEVNEIIAASNIYTAKKYGPDRIIGFSPIPAMSMVSYAAGSRYLSLIGGTCMSFYDWYCDLPPASPQTWGEQTDVPESADWYNSSYIMAWGSNVPQTRTPDAHFFTEVRYKGTKTVAITPDYSEVAKLSDMWLNPRQGTDAALAMAFGHVILKEFHVDGQSDYFDEYCRLYSDMPFLVRLDETKSGLVAGRTLRASDFEDNMGQDNNPEWKTIVIDSQDNQLTVPNGTIGSRWGEEKKWNLEAKNLKDGKEIWPEKSFVQQHDDVVDVCFPYFANEKHDQPIFAHTEHDSILKHKIPVRKVATEDGDVFVATVFDLMVANYGVDQGFGGDSVAKDFDD
ncbi:MAG: molybdopterin-dependent oxidoreductase, partial [Emcibacteraceae bacterium]|nr:molybdopterin-dependent oxidoreductase [Emcibacteraceae bacterium]